MSRLPDLSYGREIAIWCVTIAAILLVSFRAAIVMRLYWSRQHRYPSAWTAQQVTYLEGARRYIGMALIGTWIVLLMASPFLPMRHPFSQSHAVLFVMLLVQTYGWLVISTPQEWSYAPLGKLQFGHALAAVLLWWSSFLGITLYLIAKLAGPQIFQVPQMITGAFA